MAGDDLFDILTLKPGPSRHIQVAGIVAFSGIWTLLTVLTTSRALEPLIPYGPFRRHDGLGPPQPSP